MMTFMACLIQAPLLWLPGQAEGLLGLSDSEEEKVSPQVLAWDAPRLYSLQVSSAPAHNFLHGLQWFKYEMIFTHPCIQGLVPVCRAIGR